MAGRFHPRNFPLRIFSLLVPLLIGAYSIAAETKNDHHTARFRERMADCYSAGDAHAMPPEAIINGHALSPTQARNVQWIKKCVVPLLPGSAEEKATVAARTTWWSLREGILDLESAVTFRYSNCHEGGKDRSRTNFPLYRCPTNIWQVGIAAGQVANYSAAEIETESSRVFDSGDSPASENEILAWTANLAGYREGDGVLERIVQSTGMVRRSWLLRNPVIGFLLVEKQEVRNECLVEKRAWCFGSGYPSASRFSRNEASMRRSIADLYALFRES